MSKLMERLANGEILISDGAMGTMLQAAGLKAGECPESWCISNPEAVKAVAVAYVDAGSDIIESDSFGGTSYKLKEFGDEHVTKVAEYNEAAARIAKEVIGDSGFVAASVGTTGQIIEDEGGFATYEDIYNAYKEQFIALEKGGADALCIETQYSALEAAAAIKAAKDNTNLTVICTFTFEAGARGFRTMMGLTPAMAAEAAIEAGADIVGANCGNGIENMIIITKEIRAITDKPILIHANAGLPVLEDGKTVFKATPEEMAGKVVDLIEAGANIIGGCCGTTPAHINAMSKAVNEYQKSHCSCHDSDCSCGCHH